jgi:hypothetical protein
MHSKSTHERRAHAMQIAASVTGVAVVVWVTTLGFRFATTQGQTPTGGDIAQVASVVSSGQGNAQLFVATTTDSGTNQTFINQ